MIPYGRQNISEQDIDAVVNVLKSDFLTQGPMVPRFESSIVAHSGAKFAVASNSATSSLHLACAALDLGPGDRLWTSPITFVASANCALYCGARAEFVDVDPATGNMSVPALAERLEQAERDGRLPRVVVPVHLCGSSCDMRAIAELAERYGFAVIEDASHAIGGHYLEEPVGNCRWSDIAVFSFHPVKIITTGEGGVATTNDPELAHRMALLRSHGITRDKNVLLDEPHGPWYYEQLALGFNYRLTDVAAALGVSQMQRLDDFVKSRHALAKRYDAAFADSAVTPLRQLDGAYSAFHLYVILVGDGNEAGERNRVFQALVDAGIGVNVHYMPVYRQPWHATELAPPELFPGAESYYARCISLPLFPDLTEEEQGFVIDSVKELTAQ